MSQDPGPFLQPRNFGGLPPALSAFDSARVTVLPVPYDSTTEWHSGTRKGPQSIIEASFYLEWFDIELGREIIDIGIHTLPGLEPAMNGPKDMADRVDATVRNLIDKSKFVVTLGGEHSISCGAIRAHNANYRDFSVLQLDAHTDLRDRYLGTEYSHACVMRRVIEICPITQVGIRSMSLEEHEFIVTKGLKPFICTQNNIPSTVDKIIQTLAPNVYITIDLDVFDPSIMSSVGTPEPGGMLWHDVINLLHAVSQKRTIVGFDIVELCPDQGPESCSFLAAKLAYKLIGYSLKPDK
jgi:agmatinase